jgi:hypothetical protein
MKSQRLKLTPGIVTPAALAHHVLTIRALVLWPILVRELHPAPVAPPLRARELEKRT